MTRRAVAAVALLVVLTSCGRGGEAGERRTIDAGGERVAVQPLRDAAEALCSARDQARTDVKAAKVTFYDRSHDALHTLARALERVDRSQAARLLEDKQRVEADFDRDPVPAGDLTQHLGELAVVTRTGLARLSVTVPRC